MKTADPTYFQENALIHRLHSGDGVAFNNIIRHFGGDMNIVAFGVLQDAVLADKVVRDLFRKLQREKYINAKIPLRIYLFHETRADCEGILQIILEGFVTRILHKPENTQ